MSRPERSSLVVRLAKVAVLVLLSPLILLVLALHFVHKAALYTLVWLLWLPQGRDVLLVYSDSPIWREYMTTQILPLVKERAVILNWSERRTWPKWSLAVHVFQSFGGGQNFNPLIAIFRPFRGARVLRFYAAFKDWKHGHTEPVEQLRKDLLLIL